jgi:hypothetical protein
MVSEIQIINEYRPRIDLGVTVQKPELVRTLSRSTGLVEGSIDHVIMELRDHIIAFASTGRAIKVEGIGIFAPSIDLQGVLSISFRADPALTNGINVPGMFIGKMFNRENIGITKPEMFEKWNQDYPENQYSPAPVQD